MKVVANPIVADAFAAFGQLLEAAPGVERLDHAAPPPLF